MAEPRDLKFRLDDSIRWFEAVQRHPNSKDYDLCLAVAISSGTDRASGRCIRSQQWLAGVTRSNERSVRRGTERMVANGLLRIDRTETQKAGIAFGGAGRGKANVYEPIAPARPVKETGLQSPHSGKENRTHLTVKQDSNDTKTGPYGPPSPLHSHSSSRARRGNITQAIDGYIDRFEAAAGDHSTAIALVDDRWKPIRNKLAEHLGHDAIASWFGGVRLQSIMATEIVIEAPDRFKRQQIENRFSDALVRAARAADPDCTVTRARVVLAEPLKEAAQ
jgi:hypothetical protein